jgi:hypothetical protein
MTIIPMKTTACNVAAPWGRPTDSAAWTPNEDRYHRLSCQPWLGRKAVGERLDSQRLRYRSTGKQWRFCSFCPFEPWQLGRKQNEMLLQPVNID